MGHDKELINILATLIFKVTKVEQEGHDGPLTLT